MVIGVRLLGPVEFVVAGQAVDIGSPQRRAVLAALAVDAARPVATDVLIGRVWGDTPPESAARTLQAHITRLRRLLERCAGPDQEPPRLVRRSGGYALDVAVDRVDLHRFRQLWDRAQRPGTTDGERAGLLRDALEAWGGQPLAGISGGWADRVRATLERQHVATAVAWARSEMRAGAVSIVIEPLSRLVATYPLAESLTATLMQALCRNGEKADALACYAAIRRRLIDGLGVEPGRELSTLHRAVLNDDVDPASSDRGSGPGTSGTAASLLPLDIDAFTGRDGELSHLLAQLSTPPRASVVVGIWGRAGTGKTALAVHAAHRIRDHFPDGQIFLDLGGTAQPVPAKVAVSRALTALGIGHGRTPANVSDRVELYRAHVAIRRILIVLDNVADERSARPLMPVGPGCAVLITSRHRLAALESARWVKLSELDDATAVRLLTNLAGPSRTSRDQAACRIVVRLCGGLPLAVRIAAAKLAVNPHWSMGDLASRLGREQQRLDELHVGDLDVRASLAISYDSLDDKAKLGFRSLGYLDSVDFPAWVPAAVQGWDVNETADVLDRLVDHQLLDVIGRDAAGRARYRLHDLLAVFARELHRDHPSPAARTARVVPAAEPDALVPAVTAWLHLIDTLESRLLTSPRARIGKADEVPAYPLSWLPAQQALLASDEIDNASVVWELGWSLLCTVVALSFEVHAHLDDWRMTRDVAVLASRRVGDRLAETKSGDPLRVLPGHDPPWGNLTAEFEQYSQTFATSGRRRWRVATMSTLGNLYRAQGRYEEAEATLRRSIELSGDVEHTGWRIAAHFSLGSLHIMTGRLDDALTQFGECRRILGLRGDPLWHAYLLRATGYAFHQYGDHRHAMSPLTQCLPVFRRSRDRTWEAHTLLLLAAAQLGTGRLEEAMTSSETSRCLFRDEGNVRGEAMALRIAGRTFAALTDVGGALGALTDSLDTFMQIGDPTGVALTLRDRATVQRLAGHHDRADRDQRSARSLFTQLGLPRLAEESTSEFCSRSR